MATTKKELLLDLLGHAWVYLQVNGTAPGVDLPDWLRTPSVSLQIGYDMPVPIPDLRVDDWGVTCTLSFRRTPHTCRLPWSSIFAFADGEGGGILFPDDVPAELQAALAAAEAAARHAEGAPESAEATGAIASPPGSPPASPNDASPDIGPAAPPTTDDGAAAAREQPEPGGKPAMLKSGKRRPSHLKLV